MKWSSRRYVGSRSLQQRLIILLVTIFIPISLLLYFIYSFVEQTILSKVEEINQIRVEQTASRVQDLFQRIFMATNLFINDKQFLRALEIHDPYDVAKNQILLEAVERLQYAFFLNEKYTVIIQDLNGHEFVSDPSRLGLRKNQLLDFIHHREDSMTRDIFHSYQWAIHDFGNDKQFIVFTRTLFNPQTAIPKGTATIFIPITYVQQILETDKSYYEIQDEQAHVLFAMNSSPNRLNTSSRDMTTISLKIEPTDWVFLQRHNAYFLKQSLYWFYISIYVTTGLFVIIYFINSVLVINVFRKVLFQIRTISRQLIINSPILRLPTKTDPHILELTEVLRQLVHNVNMSRENYQRAADDKRKLEFQMLQHQINPHFLLNSLNSIRFIADEQQQQKLSSLLLSLSYLLQQQLYKEDAFWTFQEEKVYLEKYSDILISRYGERFQVLLNFEAVLMERPVLRMLIQPLVENCFEHAFAGREDGIIRVHAEIDASTHDVRITVADNGRGIIESESSRTRKTIGVQNVRERIRLHYGEQAEFTMVSIPDEGVTITLVIPQAKEES